jgi:hypothetical protein
MSSSIYIFYHSLVEHTSDKGMLLLRDIQYAPQAKKPQHGVQGRRSLFMAQLRLVELGSIRERNVGIEAPDQYDCNKHPHHDEQNRFHSIFAPEVFKPSSIYDRLLLCPSY